MGKNGDLNAGRQTTLLCPYSDLNVGVQTRLLATSIASLEAYSYNRAILKQESNPVDQLGVYMCGCS